MGINLSRLVRRAIPGARDDALNNFEAEVHQLIRAEVIKLSRSVIDGMAVYDNRLQILHEQADKMEVHQKRMISRLNAELKQVSARQSAEVDQIVERAVARARRRRVRADELVVLLEQCLTAQAQLLKLSAGDQALAEIAPLQKRVERYLRRVAS